MNNGKLIKALQQWPEEYEVQLSIGEECAQLQHIFIDSDSGMIELSNSVDVDNERKHFFDMFSNPVYEKSHVLCCTDVGLAKGVVDKIGDVSDDGIRVIRVLFGDEEKIYGVSDGEVNKSKQLILYNW